MISIIKCSESMDRGFQNSTWEDKKEGREKRRGDSAGSDILFLKILDT